MCINPMYPDHNPIHDVTALNYGDCNSQYYWCFNQIDTMSLSQVTLRYIMSELEDIRGK